MAVNIYRSRRCNYHRCNWWKAETASKLNWSELKKSVQAEGVFYAKEESQTQRDNRDIANAFSFERNAVTISTSDDVGELSPRDIVEFEGEIWRVENLQQRNIHKESEFSVRPSLTTYVSLRK